MYAPQFAVPTGPAGHFGAMPMPVFPLGGFAPFAMSAGYGAPAQAPMAAVPPPVPQCLNPGCTKPTWNHQSNEFCSHECRKAAGPLCLRSGCNRQTWNGQDHEYCGHRCRQAAGPLCIRDGCNYPTSDVTSTGLPNGYCSLTCRQAVGEICARQGCNWPTFDGQPGYCTTACCDAQPHCGWEGCHLPAQKGSGAWL